MKIVIDMPPKEFEHFKQFKGKFICDNGYDLIQAIKNGTPLDDIKAEKDWKFYFDHGYTQAKRDFFKAIDDIKAEIQRLKPNNLRPEQMTDYDYAMAEVFYDILSIIDKHIGKEKE